MIVKNLSATPFDDIVNCFLQAFDNYYVEFPKDPEYFKKRWEMSNIDYSLSFGMFDDKKLVGFILHGIDFRANHKTAFNLATGVIPDYRGRKITKTIYEFAIEELKKNGITKSQLEVITKNHFAIQAYENIGFKIVKNYKCFAGDIILNNGLPYALKEISNIEHYLIDLPNQSIYSWENQMESIENGEFKWYQVLNDDQVESFFIINDKTGYIPQLEVLKETEDTWNRLFSAILGISSKVKINNVDERLTSKIDNLKKAGLKNTIDQFEMELYL